MEKIAARFALAWAWCGDRCYAAGQFCQDRHVLGPLLTLAILAVAVWGLT